MSQQPDPKIVNLGREISAYLLAHPDAADTLTGIMQWWLPRLRYEESIESVRQALALLVAEGVMRRIERRDGSVLYAAADPGRDTS